MEAGFDVTCIDLNARCGRVYPGDFIHGDALAPEIDIHAFDFIWASPPCQAHSSATPVQHKDLIPDLIPATRESLRAHPLTCIENVPGAPLRIDLRLTGPAVGLWCIRRLRIFELSERMRFGLVQPVLPRHIPGDPYDNARVCIIVGAANFTGLLKIAQRRRERERAWIGLPAWVSTEEAREAMGLKIPLSRREISQSIPPPMARWIGELAIHRLDHPDRFDTGLLAGIPGALGDQDAL